MHYSSCDCSLIYIDQQENAEKILGTTSQELGQAFEMDEARYNGIFSAATFGTYNFRMRAKADTYNDETRVKHTVILLPRQFASFDPSKFTTVHYCMLV